MAEWTGFTSTSTREYFKPKEKRVKIIKGHREVFEKELDEALEAGWEIPNGEGMKLDNNHYSILVIKGQKNDKKFI